MIVKYNHDLFEVKLLNIYNGKVILNNKNNDLSKVEIIGPDHEIKLDSLYKELKKINNRYKLKEYLIIIDENFNNMEVSLQYKKNKIVDIKIRVGAEFLYQFTKEEILVYIAHEIGHILDFNSALKEKKILKSIKEFGKVVSTIIFPLYYYFYMDTQKYPLILFFTALMMFSVSYAFFIKYIKAFMSRKLEYNADVLAVKILGDVKKVIDAFYVLKIITGQNQEKSGLFCSHPSLKQRVNYLKLRFWYQYVFYWLFK